MCPSELFQLFKKSWTRTSKPNPSSRSSGSLLGLSGVFKSLCANHLPAGLQDRSVVSKLGVGLSQVAALELNFVKLGDFDRDLPIVRRSWESKNGLQSLLRNLPVLSTHGHPPLLHYPSTPGSASQPWPTQRGSSARAFASDPPTTNWRPSDRSAPPHPSGPVPPLRRWQASGWRACDGLWPYDRSTIGFPCKAEDGLKTGTSTVVPWAFFARCRCRKGVSSRCFCPTSQIPGQL